MPGSARQELSDLEHQLYQARQQVTSLKRNARALARVQKELTCAWCDLQEGNPQRRNLSAEMDTRSSMDMTKKTARMQTRRQHSVRLQTLQVNSKEVEAIPLEGMSSNSDGLLLAVDKFLSTVDQQHGHLPDGTVYY